MDSSENRHKNTTEAIEDDETLTHGFIDSPELIRRIDNYELIRKLGGGGMGDVYLARHHKFRKRWSYPLKPCHEK